MRLRYWTVRPTLAIEFDQARRFGVMALDDTGLPPSRVQLIEKPC
jgi:hypothetical protein